MYLKGWFKCDSGNAFAKWCDSEEKKARLKAFVNDGYTIEYFEKVTF